MDFSGLTNIWGYRIRKGLYSKSIFERPLGELIEDYLDTPNRRWRKKRELKDRIFYEVIREYSAKKANLA